MGGDRGPDEIVAGAVEAARDEGVQVTLVGPPDAIEAALRAHGGRPDGLEIVEATETIANDESAIAAVRGKKESSLVRGIELVRQGLAGGFVSPGHSGAVVAASLFGLGRIRDIDRPALATLIPTFKGHCLLLDVGATPECRPGYLLQFAVMGATYLELVLDRPHPRIGLLSNGEEETKGTLLVKEAHALLRGSGLNFVGNVEGKDFPHAKVDVIVTDGFTGNVTLKSLEGAAEFMFGAVREEAVRDLRGKLGGMLLRPAFRRVARRASYDEYGGAPLLGVAGVVAIAHGRSNARAIRNALRVARQAASIRLTERIAEGIARATSTAASS